jgi:hypothetical protein
MDVPTWKAIASIESSLNPGSNVNKPTQYKGLFQIGTRGDQSEWATHGSGDVYNAMDNATAAAKLAARNNAWFSSAYGRPPTPIETYMMHQQGPGFYSKGIMTNVAGNPYPGMTGQQTPESFAAGWAREIERRARQFGDPNYPGVGTSASPLARRSMAAARTGERVAGVAPSNTPGQPMVPGAQPAGQDQTMAGLTGIADAVSKLAQPQQEAMQLAPMDIPAPHLERMARARQLAQIMLQRQLNPQAAATQGTET